MSNFFATLVARTDEARRSFESNQVVMAAVADGMDIERYRALLLELYHVVWHFNPVSAAAASRLGDRHRKVRYFLYEHMHEESGHEDWVLADLREMGVPVERSLAHKPSLETLALNGYNYWAADRKHGCAALGMLYALEVIATVYGGAFTDALKERLLIEDQRGVSFIGSHATLDAEHMVELRVILNTIEEDDAEACEAVVEAVLLNFHFFTRIVGAI